MTLAKTAKLLSGGRGEDWPGLGQAYANLANAYKQLGNMEKAVEMYKKSLALKSQATPQEQQARWVLLLEADQWKGAGRKSPVDEIEDAAGAGMARRVDAGATSPRVALQVNHGRARVSQGAPPPPQQSPPNEGIEGGGSPLPSGKVHRDHDATDPSAYSSTEPRALIEGDLMVRRSRGAAKVSLAVLAFKPRTCSLWRLAPQLHELRSSARRGGDEAVLPWARVASWRGTDANREIVLVCAQPEETVALRASSPAQYDAWRRTIIEVLRERRSDSPPLK